jgi:alkylhydroperoxidase family enzyme
MDEARRVLERLARIEALDRAAAPPGELLAELRALVREAEEWARAEGGEAAVDGVVERLRRSLERDMIGV